MTDPEHEQYNQYEQYNQASNGGTVYSTQHGDQHFDNRVTNNNLRARERTWAGWAVLVSILVDVVYFVYGMTAYTGRTDDSGDLVRALIFFALLATTGTLLRRWLRRRL